VGTDSYAVTLGKDAVPVLGIVNCSSDGRHWRIERTGRISPSMYDSADEAALFLIALVRTENG